MFAEQRHQAIMQKLQDDNSVKASELMELFGVSFETIRRDLELLEKRGHLQRVHGGAVLSKLDYSQEIPLPLRQSAYVEEKQELARIAVRYVTEGMSVAMDAGTTNNHLTKALKEKVSKLTVITNSLAIAYELTDMPDYRIILTGGIIHNEEQSVIGDMAEQLASRFHPDLFFMTISGVTLQEGITDYGVGEVQVKKIFHANAKRTIALADSSKFGAVSLLRVCECGEVERFVTDSRIDRETVSLFRGQGVEIVFE